MVDKIDSEAPRVHSARSETCLLFTSMTVVLISGFFLRIIFFTGIIASDDLQYYKYSEELLNSIHLSEHSHWASRLVFLVLVGFPGVLGGNLIFSAAVNVLYASLSDIIVTSFAYCRINPRAGLIVAIFLSFSGISMVYSGIFGPDVLLTLFMGTAAILVFCALDTERPNLGLLIIAGILTGLAYSVKSPGILMLVPALFYIVLSRLDIPLSFRLKLVATYIFGFALIWFIMSIAYLYIADDFFYRINAVSATHNPPPHRTTTSFEFVRLVWWNANIYIRDWDYLLVPLLTAIPAWIVLLMRHRSHWIWALSGIFVALFLVAGTSSLTRLVYLPFQERYFQPVLPLAALSLGVVIAQYVRRRAFYWSIAIVMGAALLVLGISGAIQRDGQLYYSGYIQTAAIAVRSLPDDGKTIYVDTRTHRGLKHILHNRELKRVRRLDRLDTAIEAGYYLVYYHSAVIDRTDSESFRKKPNVVFVKRFQISHSAINWLNLLATPSKWIVEIYEEM